jgi:NADPH:quinone reductase-like Zn-dependent oxidoreductase
MAPSSALVRRPTNTTPVSASGILLAGLSAWQGIFSVGELEAGQTLFVNGGSTAVGAFAIQFAKTRGCRVVASASGKNEAYVRGLGADEVRAASH